MKLKKLLAFLLAVSMLFAFVACEKDDDDDDKKEKKSKTEASETVETDDKDNAKTEKKEKTVKAQDAVWSGYPDMAFVDFLEEGAIVLMEGDEGVDVTVTHKNGWDTEELDDADVDVPYTYVLRMEDDTDWLSVSFYMSLENGELEVYGGLMEMEDYSEFGEKEDVEGLLEQIAAGL